MINYDKNTIREELETEDVFQLLVDFGGDPIWQGTDTIISKTICHHKLNEEASHKLYYYNANQRFYCYTGCEEPSFDVFELVRKVMWLQKEIEFDLNDAVRWVAYRFGITGNAIEEKSNLLNKEVFDKYDNIKREFSIDTIELKEFNNDILKRFNYNLKLEPWLKEGISQQAIDENIIGFYPGNDQITIPHFDVNGRFIGLRGRTVCKEDAERYGKYRPLKINGIMYNHPLGLNLYNLNNSKKNIKTSGTALIFESEKSCLLYKSYFGSENDISVAVCGSSLSARQGQLLMEAGAKNFVICFDKQFQELNDNEFKAWVKKLRKINTRFSNEVNVSFVFDKEGLLQYKSSPIDEGKEKFLTLFQKRIII